MTEPSGPGVFVDGAASVTLYASLLCNARCPFCSTRVYTDDGIVSTEDFSRGVRDVPLASHTLSLEAAKQVYDRLKASGVSAVKIHGGEPTVLPHLPTLIQSGVQLGFSEQIIVTNGIRLADLEVARTWVASGVDTIAVSIYGPDAETHDASLGVSAFEALSAGVRNVIALSPGGSPSLTGQVILHARNFRSLPETIEYWHGQGLRYFAVRLLRETANTKKEGDAWFFDLAELRPLLERTLDWARQHPDVTLLFPELPLCLPGDEWLGDTLSNVPAFDRLTTPSLLLSRRGEGGRPPPRRLSGVDVCAQCSLTRHCAHLETTHAQKFTGQLRAVDVAETVHLLSQQEPGGDSIPRLASILEHTAMLLAHGVEPGDLGALRRNLLRAAAGTGHFARALVGRQLHGTLARVLRERPAECALRWLPWSSLSRGAPITARARDDLARARSSAAEREAAILDFLLGSDLRLDTPTLRILGGTQRVPRKGPLPYLVFLFDDDVVTEQQLRSLL